MRLWLSLLILAVSFGLCGHSAVAKEKDEKEKEQELIRATRMAARVDFKKLDTDGDDLVSKEEFLAGRNNPVRSEATWKKFAGDKESVTLQEYTSYLLKKAKRYERDKEEADKAKKRK